jgi:hypothetical protein
MKADTHFVLRRGCNQSLSPGQRRNHIQDFHPQSLGHRKHAANLRIRKRVVNGNVTGKDVDARIVDFLLHCAQFIHRRSQSPLTQSFALLGSHASAAGGGNTGFDEPGFERQLAQRVFNGVRLGIGSYSFRGFRLDDIATSVAATEPGDFVAAKPSEYGATGSAGSTASASLCNVLPLCGIRARNTTRCHPANRGLPDP